MDVRCERCQTEYDFDDALVSDRGTTVKCTNCGHQFKVFPVAGAARPEIWVVRSVSGGELTYTSLRDLQRAIAQGQVTPDDLLLPKGLPPRPLRSIAELDPFFGAHRPASGAKRTLAGVAPPGAAAAVHEPVAPPPIAAARPEPFAPSRSDRPPRPSTGPERPRTTTAPKLPPFDPRSAGSPRRDSERPTIVRQGAEPQPAAPAVGSGGSVPPGPATIPRPRSGEARSASAAAAATVAATAAGAGAASAGSGPGGPTVAAAANPLADTELFAAVPEDPPRRPPAPAAPAVERAPTGGTTTLGLAPAVVPVPDGGDAGPVVAAPQLEDREPPPREADAVAAPAAPVERVATPLPGMEPPRALPEVEPAPVRRDAAPALAYAPEEFFTPAPRELSFSGSLSEADPRFVPPSRARRVRAGWIVGVVLAGGLLLIGATIGVSLLRRLAAPTAGPVAAPAPSSDPRVAAYLAEGRRALAAADLDGAGAAVTKASALGEADSAVLAALAEIETVRADFVWLRLRLLDPASAERVEATTRELRQRLERAREAVDAAAAAPVPDPSSRRLRVDLLRLDGKLHEARELVVPLAERASEPETA
ncbi:MAG TPA: zinc-ribbon domain-containing protein, partial [Polyangiaceae bacterium]|nr:zinc-ribbon domain-containing protein [Polyangiaceae bacterium]